MATTALPQCLGLSPWYAFSELESGIGSHEGSNALVLLEYTLVVLFRRDCHRLRRLTWKSRQMTSCSQWGP
jgi:hypothetical protein